MQLISCSARSIPSGRTSVTSIQRNLIVVALAILAFQYYLQMSLGCRAPDDAYGALLNVLVYPLSFSLISIAIYHIEATHSRRRKMNLVCIRLLCGRLSGLRHRLSSRGAVPIWERGSMWCKLCSWRASVYGVVMIMIEMQKRRKMLESMAATRPFCPHVMISKASLFILFTAALVMPIAIISTQLLLIVGPLVLLRCSSSSSPLWHWATTMCQSDECWIR